MRVFPQGGRSLPSYGCIVARVAAGESAGGAQARAFTLIEIMIVVAILGIVLAMGAPSFVQVLSKEPLRQAVSDVTETLSHARAIAILQGISTQAVFRGDGQLAVKAIPGPGNARRGGEASDGVVTEEEAMEGEVLLSRQLHPDVAITMLEVNFRSQMERESARVRFHSNGTCDDFTIVLESRGGVRLITIDPITSLADVEVLR
jgi:prepilin-type N-terminal cleavage/methylation domain-containing protein